jgi:predicted nucleotidyltransferase
MRPSEALALHRDKVVEIIARYPVTNPRVFGSVARGEDVEGSDLDLLVEQTGSLSFFDLFKLEEELSSILDCPVEIGTKLKSDAVQRAARDVQPL